MSQFIAEAPFLKTNLPPHLFCPTGALLSTLKLSIHYFGYCNLGTIWNFPNRIYSSNTIYLVLGGDGEVADTSTCYPLRKGRAYLLPKNTPISVRCSTHVEKYWGYFDFNLFTGMDILDGISRVVDLGTFKVESKKIMLERMKRRSPQDYLYIQSIICQLLMGLGDSIERQIEKCLARGSRYSDLFKKIDSNLSADMKIEELSEFMGLSHEHLSRSFKRDMGRPLKSFINEQLNQCACTLLSSTNLTVKEISDKLGYSDQYYFMRFFKKMNGVTTVKYRQMAKRYPYPWR